MAARSERLNPKRRTSPRHLRHRRRDADHRLVVDERRICDLIAKAAAQCAAVAKSRAADGDRCIRTIYGDVWDRVADSWWVCECEATRCHVVKMMYVQIERHCACVIRRC